MLSIEKSTSAGSCTPNILPCRINHTGPTKVSKRYWAPKDQSDGTQTAYFRGRKLRGRKIKIPKGYEGVVVQKTEKCVPTSTAPVAVPSFEDDDDEAEEEDEQPEPVKILDVAATFNEVVVWGHDQLPPADDTFVKGIDEWIAFANAIHEEATDGK